MVVNRSVVKTAIPLSIWKYYELRGFTVILAWSQLL